MAFLAAALCARDAKLPFGTLPPLARAVALWMREALVCDIGVLRSDDPEDVDLLEVVGMAHCYQESAQRYARFSSCPDAS
ncbi:MAG: hypothetical protein N2690_03700 [Rhodocyclaceae bacterium]|nr:hypothetical protein [Rhodocyclaceae bacterium]